MPKFLVAASSGALIAALMFSTTALAAGPGASECGRAAGQETAGFAQAYGSGFGALVSTLSPINDLNHASLCLP